MYGLRSLGYYAAKEDESLDFFPGRMYQYGRTVCSTMILSIYHATNALLVFCNVKGSTGSPKPA